MYYVIRAWRHKSTPLVRVWRSGGATTGKCGCPGFSPRLWHAFVYSTGCVFLFVNVCVYVKYCLTVRS